MKKILFALTIAFMVTILAVSASATIHVTYDLAQETTTDNKATLNVITATLFDDEGSFGGWKNNITFDNTIIVPADYYDGSIPDLSVNPDYSLMLANYVSGRVNVSATYAADPIWTDNGDGTTSLAFDTMYTGSTQMPTTGDGLVVFKFYFLFADGKTADDFTSNSFVVDYCAYPNGRYNYYGAPADSGKTNNIVVTNNVVPAPTIITVPVTAGDIVYLQDGTFATAETTGDYVVLNEKGYVAVNTAKTSQKTYYVDGTTATLVHVNGVVGSDELAIRANGLDDLDENNKVRSGLRFKMSHNPTTRVTGKGEKPISDEKDVVTEVGFLMTAKVNSVVTAYGENPVLTMEMYNDGKNLVKKGPAYSKEDNINIFLKSENDETMIITGVFYGVPLSKDNVQTKIISRPYYIVNGEVIYGEQTEATLYEVARGIYDSEDFDSLETYAKKYIEEIVGLVDTSIVEDEIIINIGSLYEELAKLEEKA